MNVVPKRARITVITSDSKYSRAVDFLKATSAIVCQRLGWFFPARPEPFQSMARGRLLRCFFRQTRAPGHWLSINHNFNCKQFLVVGTFFTCHDVFGAPEMSRLQLFLKLGF